MPTPAQFLRRGGSRALAGLSLLLAGGMAVGGLGPLAPRSAAGSPLNPSAGAASASVSALLASNLALVAKDCSGAALAASSAAAPACQTAAQMAGTDAYIYGIPLMEFLRQRRQQTSVTVPNALSDAPLNQFGSAAQLASADPGHQVFVQPNNDTLYTMGHLDLAAGPVVLHVPAVAHGRYYVMEFLDPYTNVFHYVGTRTTGDGAGSYVIVGPGFHGRLPNRLPRIVAAYRRIWIAGRTLVDGPSDLAAVHRVQAGYRLIPLAAFERQGLAWRPPRPRRVISAHTVAREPTGLAFFDALGTALAENPPPARDAEILSELARIGIGPGRRPSREHLSAPVQRGLAAAADGGHQYLFNERRTYAAGSALRHHGWFVPNSDTGSFGTDYLWRGIVSLFGLAANRPQEAIYVVGAIDGSDQLLDGSRRYVIHIAASAPPPARYFWSMTMYDANFYLVPNALNRYALGNRSSLHRDADGSLELYLQHTPPAGHLSNWLPTPASGNFEVTLRLYGPLASALQDSYAYPTIQRVG